MLFNTTEFFVFFAIVLAVFYAAPLAFRRVILLIASYFFYLSWNYKFVVLLLGLTVVDFGAAFAIERAPANRKKPFLLISLAANLGMLGFFKYFNFFADNLAQLLRFPPHSWTYSIILPLGISFHTFQSISYVVDVYRGEQAAIRNPINYALFISFFPQLVAGPIVRAREFFSDLDRWKHPSEEEVLRGVMLIVLGLTKKMVFADQFAQIADSYFQNLAAHPGGWAAWSGVLAFAMQIFFDFSGYTDMAIGMALLLGFHFPINFRRPYLAFSITDFWHRWHISLSRWLRDYLYIPLGGNRHGRLMTYRNLMLTMLLGGLWHGASWNFVIWGGYHGSLLSIERMMGRREFEKRPPLWLYPLRALITFALVCVGWVFFRASTFADSRFVLSQLLHGGKQMTALLPRWLVYLTGASLLIAVIEEKFEWTDRLSRGPAWAYAAFMIVLLLTIEMIGVTEKAIPFVYFQF